MDLVREPTTISDRPPAVSKVVKPGEHVKKPGHYHKTVYEEQAKDVLKLLIGFRLINALLVATFFQPDEYFQALEPGWQIAFGSNSGAWITWEWQNQLRSSLHPALFGALYFVSDQALTLVSCFPQFKGMLLVALPKVLQGLFAVAGDYYTWQLAEQVYGRGSDAAYAALFMSVLSPWQWFCSTRTLSNSLEAVLTIVALNFWPWSLSGDVDAVIAPEPTNSAGITTTDAVIFNSAGDVTRLRKCLSLAGVACILRPTNLLIWIPVFAFSFTRMSLSGSTRANTADYTILLREIILCGSGVIAISGISDYIYYGFLTFPPYQWLYFNINQGLAVFYGTNDWHYYLSQGLPLLLTSYLPFALVALWSATSAPAPNVSPLRSNIEFQLSIAILTTISTLSLISHKEVRFIYPLLPALHILAAPHAYAFFNGISAATVKSKPFTSANSTGIKGWRLYLLLSVVVANATLGLYVTQVHQRGVLDVLRFLRHDYEALHLSARGEFKLLKGAEDDHFPETHIDGNPNEIFAAFLMPCHSTPWRSHLFYPTLSAWALTCEPPLEIPATSPARAAYKDEADRFYNDPVLFLKREVGIAGRRWPRYIVGFEGIEGALKEFSEKSMPGKVMQERASFFNSHFHDDSRRTGRVVVWEFVKKSSSG